MTLRELGLSPAPAVGGSFTVKMPDEFQGLEDIFVEQVVAEQIYEMIDVDTDLEITWKKSFDDFEMHEISNFDEELLVEFEAVFLDDKRLKLTAENGSSRVIKFLNRSAYTIDEVTEGKKLPPVTSCPQCNSTNLNRYWKSIEDKEFSTGFVEVGEYIGHHYEIEADVQLMECNSCGCCFSIMTV